MDKKAVKELLMYLIFGVLSTVVSWGSYTLFINALGMPVFWSNFASWVCAIVFAYITNKLWVFESKSWEPKLIIKEAGSFLASRAITGIIEIVAVPLMEKTMFDELFYDVVEKLGLSIKILFTSGIYSKIAVSFIVVLLNYVFSKLIVFKKSKD